MVRRDKPWQTGKMSAVIALSIVASLTACTETEVSETEEYSVGYDDGYAEAQEHYASKMSDAQASIEAARTELAETKAAAENASEEVSRFIDEDWGNVVLDVQSATYDTAREAQEIDYYLDEADGHLTE